MKKLATDSRTCKTWQPVRVLSIAGSDSGGGAGLQADIKTVSALGGFSATAVSAVTVQNTLGVKEVMPIPARTVCAQVEAVLEDIQPQAVKISMLPDPALAQPLARLLKKYACNHIVIDPVMVATSGHTLVDLPGVQALVKHLFPLAEIVTPNLEEVRVLTGINAVNTKDYRAAGKKILALGPRAVLVKGGHGGSARTSKDLLLVRNGRTEEAFWFTTPRVKSRNLHGTGCTLSAAIAFYLASGYPLGEAVEKAKQYIYQAIKAGAQMQAGQGNGPVNHFFAPLPLKPLPLKKTAPCK